MVSMSGPAEESASAFSHELSAWTGRVEGRALWVGLFASSSLSELMLKFSVMVMGENEGIGGTAAMPVAGGSEQTGSSVSMRQPGTGAVSLGRNGCGVRAPHLGKVAFSRT